MDFYKVKNKYYEVGLLLSLHNYGEGFDLDDINSALNFDPYAFPKTETILPSLELEKRAPLLDFIENHVYDGITVVVSQKLKTIFDKFNIQNNRSYPVDLFHKGEKHQYYCYQFIAEQFYSYYNFPETNFCTYKDVFPISKRKSQEVEINNVKEFEEISSSLENGNYLMSDKLRFNQEFIKQEIDLIYLLDYNCGIVISEQLKSEMERENIQGINYVLNLSPFENIYEE
jgi:hypothetical protein